MHESLTVEIERRFGAVACRVYATLTQYGVGYHAKAYRPAPHSTVACEFCKTGGGKIREALHKSGWTPVDERLISLQTDSMQIDFVAQTLLLL